jgi:3-isopropylmalate dehydratase small subunit
MTGRARDRRLRAEPAAYRNAEILVAGDNFGCGSSREHAPWALLDFGIRCVISTSFADIFHGNCFKNGILPIALPQAQVDVLMDEARKGANARITVDLAAQTVTTSDGTVFTFDIDPFRKHCLLNGLDDIGLTLEKGAFIDELRGEGGAGPPLGLRPAPRVGSWPRPRAGPFAFQCRNSGAARPR